MSVIETTLASSRRLEMGMAGLLTLQSAGDVRCLSKEWHAGVASICAARLSFSRNK
jgi:hypothetical protein